MDLQEFKSEMLYFQKAIDPEVKLLVQQAADNYGPRSEGLLLKAHSLDPQDLTALIGLYRFYYYQNRYQDGIATAHKVLEVVGHAIQFPDNWWEVTPNSIAVGVTYSFCLVRLYFFALKAAGYLNLRLGNFETGRAMIEKVVAMDAEDRIGAKLLLNVLENNKADVVLFPKNMNAEAC